jgi:hypothetical protein
MRTLLVLAAVAAATSLAAPAQADPGPDSDFLAALDEASISYQNGPDVGHPQPAAQQPAPLLPSWYQIQFPLPTFG